MEEQPYRSGGTIYYKHGHLRPRGLQHELHDECVTVVSSENDEIVVEGNHQTIRAVINRHDELSYWPRDLPSWSL